MYASAPVPDDFSLSQGVNACLARLHELLALLERPSATSARQHLANGADLEAARSDGSERLAYHLTAFKAHACADGATALDVALARQRTGAGPCAVEYLRWHVVHRGAPDGSDSLAVQPVSAEPLVACSAFLDAWSHHRASLFAYRWLWAWESVGDGEVFRELLEGNEFEARLTPDGVVRSVADFIVTARALAAERSETHHVLRSVRIGVGPAGYGVSADVAWEGRDWAGEPLRARTLQEWELLETGERYPRLQRLKTVTTEGSRREERAAREASGFPNEPSDDAEAGGA